MKRLAAKFGLKIHIGCRSGKVYAGCGIPGHLPREMHGVMEELIADEIHEIWEVVRGRRLSDSFSNVSRIIKFLRGIGLFEEQRLAL